jgi:hypothetical protein
MATNKLARVRGRLGVGRQEVSGLGCIGSELSQLSRVCVEVVCVWRQSEHVSLGRGRALCWSFGDRARELAGHVKLACAVIIAVVVVGFWLTGKEDAAAMAHTCIRRGQPGP